MLPGKGGRAPRRAVRTTGCPTVGGTGVGESGPGHGGDRSECPTGTVGPGFQMGHQENGGSYVSPGPDLRESRDLGTVKFR